MLSPSDGGQKEVEASAKAQYQHSRTTEGEHNPRTAEKHQWYSDLPSRWPLNNEDNARQGHDRQVVPHGIGVREGPVSANHPRERRIARPCRDLPRPDHKRNYQTRN